MKSVPRNISKRAVLNIINHFMNEIMNPVHQHMGDRTHAMNDFNSKDK